MQGYVSLVLEIICEFSSNKYNRDIFKAIYYELFIQKFVFLRHFKSANGEMHWFTLVEFHAELFSRINSAVPQFCIKDTAIAYCMSNNCLLVPQLPSQVDGDDKAKMAAMSISLDADGKREDYTNSQTKLEKWA